MIITTNQISEIFGVSKKTISLWTKRGMPKHKHGHYDAALAVQWWADNVYRADDDTEGILEAKESYWKAKARNETVKADLAEGASMPVDDLKKAWSWRVNEIFKGIMGWSMRLTPLLIGKTDKEIQSIIYNEAWGLCDQFSRTGKFTPAVKKPKKKNL
jgi:hypothetical protein